MAGRPRLASLRRPAHTGPNRCWPCTAVNLVATGLLAGVAALVSVPLGVAVALAGVSVISLRGYLVPGTPALTRRYLPERVLRWFGKDPAVEGDVGHAVPVDVERAGGATDEAPVDPEVVLRDAGAIGDCPDDDDLCVTPAFADAWRTAAGRLRAGDPTRAAALASLLDGDADPEAVRFDDAPDDSTRVFAHVGERFVGQWVSRAALDADLTAARLLAERIPETWTTLDGRERGRVPAALRVFAPVCPDCDGPIAVHEDDTGGCCWSTPVVVLRCDDCGVPLLRLDEPTVAVAGDASA
jgi:hypothetical protein